MYIVSYLTNATIKNKKRHSLPNWDLQNIVISSFIPWAVAILTFTFQLLSCEDIQGVKSRRWSTDYFIWLTSCYWMTYRIRNMILNAICYKSIASFSKRINDFFTCVTPCTFSEVKLGTSILIAGSFFWFWLNFEKQPVFLTGIEININANAEKLLALFKLIITPPKLLVFPNRLLAQNCQHFVFLYL